jgi:HTH-type transcriptional regulator, transcriptional repressor of NAD biosynthesis genes
MNAPFERGLVVGKFAPLHRGHELVISRAHELCKEVVIVSYSKPELPGSEPERRERWLGELFPRARRLVATDELLRDYPDIPELPPNDAAEAAHRRFVGLLCREVLKVRVDAVFTSEEYGSGFATELRAFFQEREPSCPEIAHVPVDPERRAVPISGSRIRLDVHAHRDWLSPAVYASFVQRVAILGGESSGKSSLAQALAGRFETSFVPEYGRELWVEREGKLVFSDLLRIAERQVELEEQAARASVRYLFCDTSPLTTLHYCRDLFGSADPKLERLAGRRYDLCVLCAPDFAFVQDGTRRTDEFRRHQHEFFRHALEQRGDPWLLAEGSTEERIGAVKRALARL